MVMPLLLQCVSWYVTVSALGTTLTCAPCCLCSQKMGGGKTGGCTSTALQGSTFAIGVLLRPWRSMPSRLWSNHSRRRCCTLQPHPPLPSSNHSLIAERNQTSSASPAITVLETLLSSHTTILFGALSDGFGLSLRSERQLMRVFEGKGLIGK
jgi:hypothetical protein